MPKEKKPELSEESVTTQKSLTPEEQLGKLAKNQSFTIHRIGLIEEQIRMLVDHNYTMYFEDEALEDKFLTVETLLAETKEELETQRKQVTNISSGISLSDESKSQIGNLAQKCSSAEQKLKNLEFTFNTLNERVKLFNQYFNPTSGEFHDYIDQRNKAYKRSDTFKEKLIPFVYHQVEIRDSLIKDLKGVMLTQITAPYLSAAFSKMIDTAITNKAYAPGIFSTNPLRKVLEKFKADLEKLEEKRRENAENVEPIVTFHTRSG